MDEVFADAFYWIALANPADQWHDTVKQFDEANPNTSLVTTEDVLTEFLNFYAEAGIYRRRIVGLCAKRFCFTRISKSFHNLTNLFRKVLSCIHKEKTKVTV